MSDLQQWLWGHDLMRFTLTYDGPLKVAKSSTPADKAAIREHFHPQLKYLWETSAALQSAFANRHIVKDDSFMLWQKHHSAGVTNQPNTTAATSMGGREFMDLCEPVERGSAKFIPLVRESFSLKCALRILVLRPIPPGGVLNNGDIDNRLKPLFDALTVPHEGQEKVFRTQATEPVYTLLEDDRDVISLEIDTKQLLTHRDTTSDFVRLIIDVETRIIHARSYNQAFLGD